MIRYNVISTGSQGNATVINDSILIDCGVSFKALKSVYKSLKIVLLTHIHTDHFKYSTIAKLSCERPTLRFACCEWIVDNLVKCGVEKKNIDVFDIGKVYRYTDFKVVPVKLYHNVPNCGYKIYFGKEKMFYATDTGTLEGITAKNYDLYMVEANYTEEEMHERIQKKEEQGIYPYEYEVMKNHLSRAKCDNFIYSNAGLYSEYVYMHQHREKGSGLL